MKYSFFLFLQLNLAHRKMETAHLEMETGCSEKSSKNKPLGGLTIYTGGRGTSKNYFA